MIKKKILHVVGARPNFMKIAPIVRAMFNYPDEFEQMLVHTGQHYDANMSQIFFEELEMPRPDINLEVGSGSHATQTAQIMQKFEKVLINYKPDWILVPGDVNSTIACALVASKLGVKIAHVEAGLRSFDRRFKFGYFSRLYRTKDPSRVGKVRATLVRIEEIQSEAKRSQLM